MIATFELPWWVDERWTLRSLRESWGLELVLSFLVDPAVEGERKKGRGIWAVAVTDGVPRDRFEAVLRPLAAWA